MDRKQILGFAHFRTDIGDGMRSGVYFNSCHGTCFKTCVPFSFLPEHPFAEDTEEKHFFTESELIEYLREEKTWCYTRPLGISFLGREPLADPFFVRRVGEGVKALGMNLHVWTCATCSPTSFDMMYGVADLFVVNLFSPIKGRHCPFNGFSFQQVVDNLFYLDRKQFPYRIRIPVLKGVNDDCPGALAGFLASFPHMKSLILDFSFVSFTEEEKKAYRSPFLRQDIVLY